MKLWVKIALLVFISANLVIEAVLFFLRPRIEQEIVELNGEKLQSIACTISSSIDGNDYSKLDFTDVDVDMQKHFMQIKRNLIHTKEILNLEEDISTLNLLENKNALVGVNSSKGLNTGDTIPLQNPAALATIIHAYQNKTCNFSELYEDENGKRVTGVAPILDADNDVVGVVRAEYSSVYLDERLSNLNKEINLFRIALIPFLILISVFVSKSTANPIVKLSGVIKNIARGDYREFEKIKSSGEVKTLIKSTDVMRQTLMEQQFEIQRAISELKKKNLELIESKNNAEKQAQIKSEFLAMISHEVRTPINIILNYLMLIEDEVVTENNSEIVEYFETIKNANHRLIRTIELIVTMSELQTNTYKLEIEKLNLSQLIREQILNHKNCAEDKGIKFSSSIDESDDFKSDSSLLKIVIDNLLDNAVKFTPKGEVTVALENISELKKIIIKVKDSGIGISESYLSEIFNVFSQEENGYTRKYDGNGIGLALVNESCKLLNIKLNISSKKEVGTEVILEIKSDNFSKS